MSGLTPDIGCFINWLQASADRREGLNSFESSSIGLCTFDGVNFINPEETANRTAGTWKPFKKRSYNLLGIQIQKMSTYKRLKSDLQTHERYGVSLKDEVRNLRDDLSSARHEVRNHQEQLESAGKIIMEGEAEIERLNLVINPLPQKQFEIVTSDGKDITVIGDALEELNGHHRVMLKGQPVLLLSDEPQSCKIIDLVGAVK